jgi:nucleoside-diphosphate-sugar epimerase
MSGFTGGYMASALQDVGYDVFGTSLKKCNNPKIFQADLCSLDSIRKLVVSVNPDVVIHMGGISNVAHEDVAELYTTNILGSRNLLQALGELKKPLQSVVLVSSANVYGNSNSELITEKSQLSPVNDYSVSKMAMENICSLWSKQLPITIVRPFNYTGIGQSNSFIIPKIVDHYARRASSIALGNIDVFREFNDVRQIVDIYRKILDANTAGNTVNVCSGMVSSLSDVVSLMNSIAGYEIDVVVDPRFVRVNEIKVLRGDNNFLINLIGPVKSILLEDTLRWMYESKTRECV